MTDCRYKVMVHGAYSGRLRSTSNHATLYAARCDAKEAAKNDVVDATVWKVDARGNDKFVAEYTALKH